MVHILFTSPYHHHPPPPAADPRVHRPSLHRTEESILMQFHADLAVCRAGWSDGAPASFAPCLLRLDSRRAVAELKRRDRLFAVAPCNRSSGTSHHRRRIRPTVKDVRWFRVRLRNRDTHQRGRGRLTDESAWRCELETTAFGIVVWGSHRQPAEGLRGEWLIGGGVWSIVDDGS